MKTLLLSESDKWRSKKKSCLVLQKKAYLEVYGSFWLIWLTMATRTYFLRYACNENVNVRAASLRMRRRSERLDHTLEMRKASATRIERRGAKAFCQYVPIACGLLLLQPALLLFLSMVLATFHHLDHYSNESTSIKMMGSSPLMLQQDRF